MELNIQDLNIYAKYRQMYSLLEADSKTMKQMPETGKGQHYVYVSIQNTCGRYKQMSTLCGTEHSDLNTCAI